MDNYQRRLILLSAIADLMPIKYNPTASKRVASTSLFKDDLRSERIRKAKRKNRKR